jgi:hypothetical protein
LHLTLNQKGWCAKQVSITGLYSKIKNKGGRENENTQAKSGASEQIRLTTMPACFVAADSWNQALHPKL